MTVHSHQQAYEDSNLSISSLALVISCLFDYSYRVSVQWYLVVMICISWLANDVEHLLMCLFTICIVFFGETSIKILWDLCNFMPFLFKEKKIWENNNYLPFFSSCISQYLQTSLPHFIQESAQMPPSQRFFLIILPKEALIPYLSFHSYPVLFSECTCHSLI